MIMVHPKMQFLFNLLSYLTNVFPLSIFPRFASCVSTIHSAMGKSCLPADRRWRRSHFNVRCDDDFSLVSIPSVFFSHRRINVNQLESIFLINGPKTPNQKKSIGGLDGKWKRRTRVMSVNMTCLWKMFPFCDFHCVPRSAANISGDWRINSARSSMAIDFIYFNLVRRV